MYFIGTDLPIVAPESSKYKKHAVEVTQKLNSYIGVWR